MQGLLVEGLEQVVDDAARAAPCARSRPPSPQLITSTSTSGACSRSRRSTSMPNCPAGRCRAAPGRGSARRPPPAPSPPLFATPATSKPGVRPTNAACTFATMKSSSTTSTRIIGSLGRARAGGPKTAPSSSRTAPHRRAGRRPCRVSASPKPRYPPAAAVVEAAGEDLLDQLGGHPGPESRTSHRHLAVLLPPPLTLTSTSPPPSGPTASRRCRRGCRPRSGEVAGDAQLLLQLAQLGEVAHGRDRPGRGAADRDGFPVEGEDPLADEHDGVRLGRRAGEHVEQPVLDSGSVSVRPMQSGGDSALPAAAAPGGGGGRSRVFATKTSAAMTTTTLST